jgi:hypothetical protein
MYKVSLGTAASGKDPSVLANQKTAKASTGDLSETQVGVFDYINLLGGGTTTNPTAAAAQAAVSSFSNTFYESYTQTAVPEPVSFLLVGTALSILGVCFRRRRRT